MKAISKKKFDKQRGAAVAEFAVSLPIAMLMLLGAADFGRVFVTATAASNAAQAGAQYGAQTKAHSADSTGIANIALSDLQNSAIGNDGFEVTSERHCECSGGTTVDCDMGTCGPGVSKNVYVRVRVDTTFETLFDYPGIPPEIEIAREARLRAR
jgi:Flp pilus assembly protein TadG